MKATPGPIVSGKNFFPNAPLLCVKRIPAFTVTSTNCAPACAADELAPVCAPGKSALDFVFGDFGAAFALCVSLMFPNRREKHSRAEETAAANCFKASPEDYRGQR